MRKPILLLALFFLASTAHAQCSGSGLSGSCTASSTLAQINAEINTLSDGATLTLGAGTYTIPSLGGGAAIQFKPTKGLTIICATAPLAVGAATTNPCLMQGVGPTFGTDNYAGTVTNFYRISGFTLDGGGAKPALGTVYWDSYNGSKNATVTQIRVDHNTFQNFALGAQTTLIGDIQTIMQVYGVYDHNLYTGPVQAAMVIWIGKTSTTPVAGQLGTGNNLFFEDNTLTYTSIGGGSAEGCTDGWGGSAYVLRHNTSTNCLWALHGVTHSGGPANVEFYNNHAIVTDTVGGFDGCYRCFHHQGSGTIVAFNNTFTPVTGHTHSTEVISVFHYRDYSGDAHSFSPVTTVSVSGTTVTYTGTFTGCPGIGGCTGFYNMHGFANAGNNQYIFINTATSTTQVGTTTTGTQVNESGASAQSNNSSIDGSIMQCDGTISNISYGGTTISDGNRSPLATNQGYPCWHQPGRDTDGTYKPMYEWNNTWTDTGAQVLFTMPTASAPFNYKSNHMQQGREWFDAVSTSAQSNPTTPFDGVTGASAIGMGFGTLANRPVHCTTSTESALGAGAAGVGYFATDVGAQGTLYTCSATNTWTVYYTPYTYPHPLVTTTTSPAINFSPQPLVFLPIPAGSTSAPQALTITNTGTGNLTVSALNSTGNFAFVGGGTCSAVPFTLTPGSFCTVNLTFAPIAIGGYSQANTTTDNTSTTPSPITLTGTGIPISSPVPSLAFAVR
jgi:hypothetical protein